MGAWGPGSFENDDALDLAGEIGTVVDIENALTAAGVDYVDAMEGARVIVAAECVAAMRGHPNPDMPDELAKRVHGFGQCPIELFDEARNNLSAVMSRGELNELWAEQGSGDWNRAVTDLMERLNKPVRRTKEPSKQKAAAPNPSPCMFCDKPMGNGEFHMLDIVIQDDEISTSKQGGWVHLQCLNAALHPKHMIQNWQFDDELLELVLKKIEAGRG